MILHRPSNSILECLLINKSMEVEEGIKINYFDRIQPIISFLIEIIKYNYIYVPISSMLNKYGQNVKIVSSTDKLFRIIR
jgi:hypothetical protein